MAAWKLLDDLRCHLIVSGCIPGILVVFLAASVVGCGTTYKSSHQSISPNGRFRAVAYVTAYGGATGGVSTDVVVYRSSWRPLDRKNVFSARGEVEVKLKWQGDNHLIIYHAPFGRVRYRVERFRDLSIEYRLWVL